MWLASDTDVGIQQPRVNLQQQLFALKRVFDPFGAGIDIRGRAGDHRVGREDGRHIVEHRDTAPWPNCVAGL